VLFRMYVYVVWTCIQCGTNVYLGGTEMGGTKRRWYEKPGYQHTGTDFRQKTFYESLLFLWHMNASH